MCDRRPHWGAILAGLATFVIASSGAAQTTDPLATHRRAVVAARAALEAASARAGAESARRAQLPVVRNLAGLEVRADTTQIPAAVLRAVDAEFASAMAEARTLFGPPADTLIQGIRLTITPGTHPLNARPDSTRDHVVQFQSSGTLGRGFTTVVTTPVDRQLIHAHFASWFNTSAWRRLPVAISLWSNSGFTDAANEALRDRQQYATLATSPWPAARACIAGSLQACRVSLAIVPNGDTSNAWTDANTRREFVRDKMIPRHEDIQFECVNRHRDESCWTLLRVLRVESPTGANARQDLVRHALLKGGPDAFRRLVTTRSDDVGELLEIAAGVPVDTLIDEWRARIVAARTPPPTPDGRELGIAAAVCVAVIGLSARRRP